jgi:hypothetical protein
MKEAKTNKVQSLPATHVASDRTWKRSREERSEQKSVDVSSHCRVNLSNGAQTIQSISGHENAMNFHPPGGEMCAMTRASPLINSLSTIVLFVIYMRMNYASALPLPTFPPRKN